MLQTLQSTHHFGAGVKVGSGPTVTTERVVRRGRWQLAIGPKAVAVDRIAVDLIGRFHAHNRLSCARSGAGIIRGDFHRAVIHGIAVGDQVHREIFSRTLRIRIHDYLKAIKQLGEIGSGVVDHRILELIL